MKKFCFFDVDSTLVTIEWCDRLAEQKGCGEEVSTITNAAMNGLVDFDISFAQKHRFIHPTLQEIDMVWQQYCKCITPWCDELIAYLTHQQRTVWLLTHGYHEAAVLLWSALGISSQYIFGLQTEHDTDGTFLWLSDHPLRYKKGKSELLRTVRKQETQSVLVFIGDSATDLTCEPETDLFIGCGLVIQRPFVQRHARHFCQSVDEIKMLLARHQEHSFTSTTS